MADNIILGVDIGGSGIKGALVDLEKGVLLGERFRVPTPKPATPENMAEAFTEVVDYFDYKGTIGAGFPAIIKNGVALSAANIDESWINVDIEKVFGAASGCKIICSNDADVAGVAEMHFGAGRNNNGLVLLITIGTGLGSALFYNKVLIPNTEFGHVIWPKKKAAEIYASSKAREKAKISRKAWAKRFNGYLNHIERILSPDLIILGGGESKKFDEYKDLLITNAPVVPAEMKNNAGIIGAAMYAKMRF